MKQSPSHEPNESAVRDALRGFLRVNDRTPCIQEFWIPRSNERADLVVVQRSLRAFEIKTARDTLTRLPRQVSAYGRVFGECAVVVAEKHLAAAIACLPEWWGVYTFSGADGAIKFRSIRDGCENRNIDAPTLVRLLWRDEANDALLAIGDSSCSGLGRSHMWDQLLRRLDVDALQRVVRTALSDRSPARARIRTRHFADLGALSSVGT